MLGGSSYVWFIQLRKFDNWDNAIQNGDKKSTMPMTWATNHGQPIENVVEEVSIVTEFDEERKWLWELPNTTSKKPGLDRKIMLTSSITKWILRKQS
jgi:hypothetical protein